jgi:hypothetical protein
MVHWWVLLVHRGQIWKAEIVRYPGWLGQMVQTKTGLGWLIRIHKTGKTGEKGVQILAKDFIHGWTSTHCVIATFFNEATSPY